MAKNKKIIADAADKDRMFTEGDFDQSAESFELTEDELDAVAGGRATVPKFMRNGIIIGDDSDL